MSDATPELIEKNPGDSGARGELRQLKTAVRNEWPISAEKMASVSEKLLQFVENGNKREATAAARVLVAMARHNDGGPGSVHLHQHGEQTGPVTGITRQKATLEHLAQQSMAFVLGVGSQSLRDQLPPRNVDATYSAPAVVEWHVNRQIEAAKMVWERERDAIKTANERQAEARADKLEVEARKLQGEVISRQEAQQALAEMASAVRSELEALPIKMCNDFPPDRRDENVREVKNHINQVLRRLAQSGDEYTRVNGTIRGVPGCVGLVERNPGV